VQGGLKNIYDSIKAFSEPTYRDLKKSMCNTRLHGDDDQIVPIKDSSKKSAQAHQGAKENFTIGEAARLTAMHQDEVNADLLKFLRSVQEVGKASLNLCATAERATPSPVCRGVSSR